MTTSLKGADLYLQQDPRMQKGQNNNNKCGRATFFRYQLFPLLAKQ